MKKWSSFVSLVVALLVPGVVTADVQQEFPHREKFKSVQVIEIDELRRELDHVILVDVRTRYEYDTLHIKGAVHVTPSKDKLPEALRELRARSPKPFVFYCNGTTCKKSYEAVELAQAAGFDNIRAYDAGLDAWTRLYPDLSVLLGKSPVRASDLISSENFKKRLINGEDFEARLDKGAVVLDIRDLRQRDIALFPMRELRAPLDDSRKIAEAVTEAKKSGKPLLVYDKVGKQTRWFQYYLEMQGVKEYYFLNGGSEGYHEAKYGKPKFQVPDQS